jgi:hypothetical protein
MSTIPDDLKQHDNWVLWRYQGRNGKRTKVPYCVYDPTKPADTSDPQTWDTYASAERALRELEGTSRRADGLGRVFSASDGLCGVDLDNCLGADGAILPWAQPYVRRLAGSYCEISPSGRGLKFWVRAELPGRGSRKTGFGPDGSGAIEIYDCGRYFTVTGHLFDPEWTTVEDRQEAISALYHEIAPKPSRNGREAPCGPPLAGDDDLLARARKAKNGRAFADLYEGRFPTEITQSEADFRLCCHLAFWFHRDPAAIDRVFRASKLMRDKWDERRGDSTYGAITIDKAIGVTTEVYTPRAKTKSKADGKDAGPGGAAKKRADSQAVTLLRMAEGATLFKASDGTLFATIPFPGAHAHRENHPIRGPLFKRWLVREFFIAKGHPPSSDAVQQAIGVLEARAQFEGDTEEVRVRVAGTGDDPENPTFILDLGDDRWSAIEITRAGWKVIEGTPPVKFRRAKGMLALPMPRHGKPGEISEAYDRAHPDVEGRRGRRDAALRDLRGYVNIPSEDDWLLFLACLAAAFRPFGPYPILGIHGEQGSAKSTTTRVFRRLVDPNVTPLRDTPKEPRDLMIAAKNALVTTLENLSSMPPWLADSLCRLATGGGLATRELYTNDDEVLFDAQRPIVLNGIEDVETRFDLLDRCVILALPPLDPKARREERPFWRAFEADHPRFLGAVLDLVVDAIAEFPAVPSTDLPRMADFARWGEAVGRALGREHGHFLKVYAENAADATDKGLDASIVAVGIRRLHALTNSWEGTAMELLDQLTAMASDVTRRQKDWPTKPNALSGKLKRVAPALRKVGIEIVFHPRNHNRRLITIRGATPTAQPGAPADTQDVLPNEDAFALRREDGGDDGDDPRDDPETIVTHIVTPAVNPQGVDRHDDKEKKMGLGDDGDDGDDDFPTLTESPRRTPTCDLCFRPIFGEICVSCAPPHLGDSVHRG